MDAGSGEDWVDGVAQTLLCAWLENPSPEAAGEAVGTLRPWMELAAEGACRIVGLGVDPLELVTSFWARVLLGEDSDVLVVDLLAGFENAARIWMVEAAEQRVAELASSRARRGSCAWVAMQSLQDSPRDRPCLEDVVACIALHRLGLGDRTAIVAAHVYGDEPGTLHEREALASAVARYAALHEEILNGSRE